MAMMVLRPIFKVALAPVALIALTAMPGLSQSAGDMVVIGNSPMQWSQNQFYWNQILGVSSAAKFKPTPTQPFSSQATINPQSIEKELLSRIQISGLQLSPIIKLNGSSQVSGTVSNGNSRSVTIAAVNFVVLDASGKLLQTGSAVPLPATIGPGQASTFQTTLLTVPPDIGAKVMLGNPPITIQGGV
jgi:hypothetical protein